MTRRRKTGKKRTNETAHWRALADSKVASLIKDLRIRWKSLDGIERGDRPRDLAGLGCSTRGLGKALGQSATSIRRHIDISKLPNADREALRNGQSAKKILAKKAVADRARRARERVRADNETGVLSDEMADLILDFCRTRKGVPETPVWKSALPQFMECVTNAVNAQKDSGRSYLRLSKRLSTQELFKRTRPPQEKGELWMEYKARWLARVICARTPEGPIWQRALQKTARRAKELEPPKTPLQHFDERAKYFEWLNRGPERRKY
jgi:hypothetical protein